MIVPARRPLLLLAAALWAGLFLRAGQWGVLWTAVAACAVAAAGVSLVLAGRGHAWGLLVIGAGLWCAAAVRAPAELTGKSFFRWAPPGVESLGGVLLRDSWKSGGSEGYLVAAQEAVAGGGTLVVRGRAAVVVLVRGGPPLAAGTRLRVRGLRRGPEAAAQGSGAPGAILYGRSVETLGFRRRWQRWRASLLHEASRRLAKAGPEDGALLVALLLGDRRNMPSAAMEGFRASGLLHLLALSGLHVAMIYALPFAVARRLAGRKAAAATGAAAALFYLFMAGWRPSLARASIMLAGASLGTLADRRGEPLNLLGLAGAAILLADPAAATELSFQLSFLSILGIVVASPPLARGLRPWAPRWLCDGLACGACAQLFTAPLLLAHFGRIYPGGVLAGLAALPLVAVMLWGGIALVAAGALPWAQGVVLPVVATAGRLLRGVQDLFGGVPSLSLHAVDPLWLVAGLAAAAGLGLSLLRRRGRPGQPVPLQ